MTRPSAERYADPNGPTPEENAWAIIHGLAERQLRGPGCIGYDQHAGEPFHVEMNNGAVCIALRAGTAFRNGMVGGYFSPRTAERLARRLADLADA